jgi:outer membrane protein OmpA-like peptidoglycan-associated protein/ABC-type nitrate/sulfonate/bicarbonate transport system substrate-binding protein
MRRQTLFALVVVLLAVGVTLSWRYLSPIAMKRIDARRVAETSDATVSTTFRIGGDGYLGYWFLVAPDTRREAARRGIGIAFEDDGGAYADRVAKFAAGGYDAIVLPINSYLLHGEAHRFPGAIVLAIAESRGADGIVAFADKIPGGKVTELDDASLRIVYTRESPSSFLLDLTIADFELANLAGSRTWRQEVGGVGEVVKRAQRHEGDAFVLWEPELSQALHDVPELRYVWGSDKFSGYIKDVLVMRRDVLQSREADVAAFLSVYFRVMDAYAADRDRMLADMAQTTGLRPQIAETMLAKIDWYDAYENASQQFGVQTGVNLPVTEGIVRTIIACTDVLRRTGTVKRDPLAGDPYQIVNSAPLRKVLEEVPRAVGPRGPATSAFTPLDADAWRSLHEIGMLRVEPITFQSGTQLLDDDGKAQIDRIAELLINNYPAYRIAVRGHTGSGDPAANLELSQMRADVVVQYLQTVHAIPASRLHAEGKGDTQPPPRRPGESERAYGYRWPRVEFVLLQASKL